MKTVLAELQEQSRQNMTLLATHQREALREIVKATGMSKSSGLTDGRGIGRPTDFTGKETRYQEWKAKLVAYLRSNNHDCPEWIRWAAACGAPTESNDIQHIWVDTHDEVEEFSVKLYAILLSCTEDAFRICHSVADGNGLEAMRLLMRRFEPRTPGTKRSVLKAIINNPAAQKAGDVEKNLMQEEEYVRTYEQMANYMSPDGLKVTVIIGLCPKEFRDHLEVITKDKDYKEARDEVMAYVERKREQFGNQLQEMEVDNYERWGQ